ncbi:MAG TPA: J domain-containing protein [Stackebrandtia sp.]|uniref:J domain-containing protein n=1 Tax=Stackebrandtia sp. TaxID=2023065 RepID=UPI002D453888|nr:J domain-containing protein [Stackebrandtia sp.]HZE37447.1 J domain-containing protein [Stackebrandtia sp.]
MTEPDYYKILGVTPAAEAAEIRRAYRHKVRDAHPDAGGDPETFHILQEAYETLTDTQRRLEYDAATGNRRPVWQRGSRRAPGRHTKSRKVKAWRVNTVVDDPPGGPGEVMARPWFIDIDPNRRLRYAPSVWQRGSICAAAGVVWLYLSIQLCALVLSGSGPAPLRALIVPYVLLVTAFVVAACVRVMRPAKPLATIIGVAAAALIVAWLSGFSLAGVLMGLHLMGAVALPWTVRQLRFAVRLLAAVRTALRDFNAFAPGGARPSADRRTGAVLRTLLERLPAARLFVRVPVGARRAEYTVVCGRRVAVIAPPIPRSAGDSGAAALPGAVDDVSRLLSGVQVRGFVVWPNLPVDRISGADAVIRHLSAPDAAGEIGRWLANDPYTLHLPTLRRLRDRLAAADAATSSPRHTVEV